MTFFSLVPEKSFNVSQGEGQVGRGQGLQDRQEERAGRPRRLQVGLGQTYMTWAEVCDFGRNFTYWATCFARSSRPFWVKFCTLTIRLRFFDFMANLNLS